MRDDIMTRLRIVEAYLPRASQVGITDPKTIVEKCSELEKYVLGSETSEGKSPDSPKPGRRRGRPPKGDNQPQSAEGNSGPAHADKPDTVSGNVNP